MKPAGTLIFEHLPKTAGITLRSILEREYKCAYKVDDYSIADSIAAFENLNPQQQNSFDLIYGHASSVLAKYVKNPILLTYLRNPVDRFISQYCYIKINPAHRTHKSLQKVTDIEEYIDFSLKHQEDNIQTRFLSNAVLRFVGELQPSGSGIDMQLLLNQAKNRLRSFRYVFFTHQFDLSLLILKKDLNWTISPYYVKWNLTPRRYIIKDLSPSLIDRIKNLERYDLELFEFAQTINNEFLSGYDLKDEVASFKMINQLRKPVTWMSHYFQRITELFAPENFLK